MIEVSVANVHPRLRVPSAAIIRGVRSVLAGVHIRRAAVSVLLIDRHRCRRLNSRFLGHHYETDVLSFPLEQGELLEAEVYVNLDRARTQATRYGVTFRNEVLRLAIHGTLHLAGFDDSSAGEARIMREREGRYLSLAARDRKPV